MKRKVLALLSTTLVAGALVSSTSIFEDSNGASAAAASKVGTNVNKSFVLKGEVGTILTYGGLTFERVEKDSNPSDAVSTTTSKSDFLINLNGSEKSQAFTIDKDYPFANVYVNNTGTGNIIFTITKSSPTGAVVSGSDVTIPAGNAWNIYTQVAWASVAYYANFTSGKVAMSGTSSCRLASTFKELDLIPHRPLIQLFLDK